METAEFDVTIRRWGNSLAFVVPAQVARRMELRPGATVHLTMSNAAARNDPDKLPSWDLATDYDIDEIADKEYFG